MIGAAGRQLHALVYGDVNLNIIDGSAVWAPATVEVLAGAGCRVTLLLKGRVTTTRLIDPVQDLPAVRVVRPFEEGLHHDPKGVLMSPDRATKVMLRLDTDWYSSTKHELVHLYPRLAKNGVLILDDYGDWQGARKAVDEYFAETGDKPLLNRIGSGARIGVKV